MGIYGFSYSPNTIQRLPSGVIDLQIENKINQIVNALNLLLLSPSEVSSATQIIPGNIYVANHASVQVVFTLPLTAAQGDTIAIIGKGAAGWKVAQNAGQTIHSVSNTTTGITGSISSGSRYACVVLTCIIPNTDFVIVSHESTIPFV